jgi:hypothetical protein
MLGHGRPSHPAPLACLLLTPTRRTPHLRRSLLAPICHPSTPPTPLAPRSGHAPPTPSRSARRLPDRAKAGASGGCARTPLVLVLVVLARRRMPPRRPESTSPDLPLPYIAIICFRCFRCYRGTFQLFHMDVAKADRDVAHVASVLEVCCKSFVQNVLFVSNVCCKCFIWMLHML